MSAKRNLSNKFESNNTVFFMRNYVDNYNFTA